MNGKLSLSIFLMLLFAFQAYPCFSPTDMFAVEVTLNKPGIDYDLERIESAVNVVSQDGSFVYQSHFDPRVAAILKVMDGENLPTGLSVRLQIPTQTIRISYITIDFNFPMKDGQPTQVDATSLKSLGYEVQVARKENEDFQSVSVSLTKDDIDVNIILDSHRGANRAAFSARISDADELNDAMKTELKQIFRSLGLDESVLDTANAAPRPGALADLVEARDIDRDTFDFLSAMKAELEWLKKEGIIAGSDDKDIAAISQLSTASQAGWNNRVVYENGKWLLYSETKNPLFFDVRADCGGFELDNLPDDVIILPSTTAVHPQGKISTTWGKMKVAH